MAISRQQLAKELEPGLNALFGLEYKNYENQHTEIFDIENSDRAFEEEVMLSGFANAAVKAEGAAVTFDNANESFTSRYTHETVALAFAITEEAVEDNLYDSIARRYTKALARSMANTKQIKAANVLNNGFSSSFPGGDGKELFATDHPTVSAGDLKNELSTSADLSETSLEQAMIDIAAFKDERGLKIAARGLKLIIPSELQFTAERILKSPARVGTADNDLNALSSKGMIPQGYVVNNFLTDTDAFFINEIQS
jgi:phage major head subunit gpT-like protein